MIVVVVCLFARQTSGEKIPGGRVMTLDPELLKPMKKRKRRDYLSPSEEESEMETMVRLLWYCNCTGRVCPNVPKWDLKIKMLKQKILCLSRGAQTLVCGHHFVTVWCYLLLSAISVQILVPNVTFLCDCHDSHNQTSCFCSHLWGCTWIETQGLLIFSSFGSVCC